MNNNNNILVSIPKKLEMIYYITTEDDYQVNRG